MIAGVISARIPTSQRGSRRTPGVAQDHPSGVRLVELDVPRDAAVFDVPGRSVGGSVSRFTGEEGLVVEFLVFGHDHVCDSGD